MRKNLMLVLGGCALVALASLVVPAAADVPDLLTNRGPARPAKDPGPGGPVPADPPEQRVGGDTCANPTVIPSLPYTDTGDTSSFFHDYDEVCPYSGGTAPDVVYSYQPAVNETVNISLCDPNTAYDTKLYVYEGTCPDPNNPFACDDDGCDSPGLASQLNNLELTGGTVYYIVVDGYGTNSGYYVLTVDYPPTCPCTNGTPENEADCGMTPDPNDPNVPIDTVNGGCNQPSHPYWTEVSCGETICGTTGAAAFPGGDFRDTDWYNLTLPVVDNVTVTLTSPSGVPINLFNLSPADCGTTAVVESDTSSACGTATVTFAGVAGDNWIWVGSSLFDSPACAMEYTLTVTCETVPVELQSMTLE